MMAFGRIGNWEEEIAEWRYGSMELKRQAYEPAYCLERSPVGR